MTFTHIFAQHISFLGIQLGQSQATIDRLLRQKGFRYTGEAYEPAHMYEGAFWIYQNVSILARTYNGRVTEIIVSPSKYLYNKMSDFNNLVSNLNRKYGNYHSTGQYPTLNYNWQVKGGRIQANCVDFKDSVAFNIRYIDYTSVYYNKPQKRNWSDDL